MIKYRLPYSSRTFNEVKPKARVQDVGWEETQMCKVIQFQWERYTVNHAQTARQIMNKLVHKCQRTIEVAIVLAKLGITYYSLTVSKAR